MLRILRDSAGSWVAKIFLGLLALSFAAWGVGDMLRGSPDVGVATVAGETITSAEFSRTYRREFDRLSQQLGGRVTQEQARDLGLADSTLQQMIGRTLFARAANDLGLAIGTAAIVAEIRGNQAFYSAGQFDQRLFERAISSSGFNEAGYIAAARADTVRLQLVNTVTGDSIAPTVLVDQLYTYREEKRVIELLVISRATQAEPAVPNEIDIETYYREHEAEFAAPEYRTLGYIVLDPEDVAKEIAVTDKEIQEEYDHQAVRFTVQERREVEQLLYDTEEVAAAARQQLVAGTPLVDVAKATASRNASAPSLGLITRDKLPADVGATVFALDQGAFSVPIKSAFGWHVFRVAVIQAGSVKPLSDVSNGIKRDVALHRAGDSLVKLAEKIEDEFAGGAKVGDVAQKFGLKIETSTVDSRGLDANGKQVERLARLPRAVATGFAASIGAELRLNEAGGGVYFALSVESITPSAVKPLATVRDTVKKNLVDSLRDAATRKNAEAIQAAIKGGAKFSDHAKDGLTTKVTAPLLRYRMDIDPEVSLEMLTAIFKLKHGELAVAALPGRNGYGVALLKEIQPASSGPTTAREEFRREIARAVAADVGEAYQSALQAHYGVEIKRKALEQAL